MYRLGYAGDFLLQSLPPRGCARRRVSKRNRRRRLLARRLKVAPQGRMRGEFAAASRLWVIMANLPRISQRAGPLTASPSGEAQTAKKGAPLPWPPLRGGSARRRWGRELYGNPKYFGLWQGSLPPPLRGTAPPLAHAPPPPYRGSLSRRGRQVSMHPPFGADIFFPARIPCIKNTGGVRHVGKRRAAAGR